MYAGRDPHRTLRAGELKKTPRQSPLPPGSNRIQGLPTSPYICQRDAYTARHVPTRYRLHKPVTQQWLRALRLPAVTFLCVEGLGSALPTCRMGLG